MFSEANLVTDFATELVDEAVGASSHKWAIAALMLLVGAGIALWFVKRQSGGGEQIATEVTPVPSAPAGAAAAS